MTCWHWFATPDGAAALVARRYEGNGDESCMHGTWWETPCDDCMTDIIRAAIEIERAAVVAWLRSDHASACCKDSYADAIERGEHRR